MIEPVLEVDKQVSAMNIGSSRTVTYSITIDHAATSNSDAFDVLFRD